MVSAARHELGPALRIWRARPLAAGRWTLDGRLTKGFGPTSFTAEPARWYEGHCFPHFHDGIDIAATLGTPVRAIATGRVVLAGRMSDGAIVVEIEHSQDVISLYEHLNATLSVRGGDSVSPARSWAWSG